jgi:hypothetical protein
MNRRALGATAFVLILLMVIVATAGLDNLPRELRTSVEAASTRVNTDRTLFQQRKSSVEHALAADPALFRSKEASWREKLNADEACLANESAALASIQEIAKANRRADREKVEQGLSRLDQSRGKCTVNASAVDSEAQRWLNYKRELPARLAAMNAAHEAIAGFNVDAATTAVAKAETDWPAKQQDLENRLADLKRQRDAAEQMWTSSAALRAKAERNDLVDFDYAAFFQSADGVEQTARNLKDGAASANTLASQLYTNWDKLLLKVEVPDARQKIRIVKTKFPDSTLANGVVTSEERWERIDASRARDVAKNEEMVIERKPAGKYDSEAERVVQPPAYAYIAPPGQANAYGSWQNGVWQWLPQYLLLSHLLNTSRQSIGASDYDAWQRARQRGEVYYGRNRPYGSDTGYRRSYRPGILRSVAEAILLSRGTRLDIPSSSGGWYKERPRSSSSGGPSSGGWYQERPKPTWGSSGYGGSKYQSRGGFSGSRYQSRGTFGSGMRGGFGRGGRR